MTAKLEGSERRLRILQMLENSAAPVSGTAMAKALHVSRQVIVQDIALLRASEENILSTPRGYLMYRRPKAPALRRVRVSHTGEQMEQELNLIVDSGAHVLNVIVEHPVYGEICGNLPLSSRRDVRNFIRKINSQEGTPLLEISRGVHIHTLQADREEILDAAEEALRQAGFLLK